MKVSYRPEIDGLRTIAVVAVILYHSQNTIFGYQPFKGGFIGVDIFFVISGYLITSIILKELVTTGSFSFKHFYERRIRRILPALLFVILASLPFAWIYLLPGSSFVDFSKSILYSLGFSSNFYFHYSGQVYGAKSGLLIPFLHTWSLSVEEQYYILYPIVLFITFKYFRKYIGFFLVTGFIISLVMADWGSRNHPSFNFYVLPTRGWELIAGSILAYYEIHLGHRSKYQTLNFILPSAGLFLIGHSILLFDDKTFHPSFYTLSPIIGVCLIIWFSHKDELITKILSSKLFVVIGLISYSLYLWHYPIFAFARITQFISDDNKSKIFLIIITVFISIFSYFIIEKPFRNKKISFYKLIKIILLLFALFITFSVLSIFNQGFKSRIPSDISNKIIQSNELENQRVYWEKCVLDVIKYPEFCSIGNFEKKAFLIGDSHVIPLERNLGERLNAMNYSLISMYQPTFIFYRNNKRDEIRYDYLKNIKNSILIFGGYYQRESKENLEKLSALYKEKFDIFKSNGNQIILIYPIPLLSLTKNKFINNKIRKGEFIEDFIDVQQVQEKNKNANEFFNQFQNVNRVFPANLMCKNSKCYGVTRDNILKSDRDHPSLFLSEKINTEIINIIKKIEAI